MEKPVSSKEQPSAFWMPTLRDHWVWDEESLLAHEFNFGWAQGRDPKYVTQPGNFAVTGWNDYEGKTCPETTVQVAALVGGEPAYWQDPDWEGGAWVYEVLREGDDPIAYHVLTASRVPGAEIWIDYWNGQTGQADKLTNWEMLALSEASFTCEE